MSKPQGLPREPSRAEEDALVERILRGDKKAMDELVLGYTHAMSTFVRTQSRETLTAHEALSVAWDVLQMARVQWDATRYPHSRFLHYARWYIKSGIRRSTAYDPQPMGFSGPKTQPRKEMPAVLKEEDPTVADVSTTDTVIANETEARMFEAVAQLQDRKVRAVMLLAAKGFDCQDISRRLKQARSTVYGRYNRGIVLLRALCKKS